MMQEVYDTIKLGITLPIDGMDGMICHKAMMDNRVYVNISFDLDDGMIDYKPYEVIRDNNDVIFVKITDDSLINKLLVHWMKEELESND